MLEGSDGLDSHVAQPSGILKHLFQSQTVTRGPAVPNQRWTRLLWSTVRLLIAKLARYDHCAEGGVRYWSSFQVLAFQLVLFDDYPHPTCSKISQMLKKVESNGGSDFQSESRVLNRVFWTFSFLYLWHTMWFHTEKLLKTLKFLKSLNSLYKSGSWPQKSPNKSKKTTRSIFLNWYGK